MSARRRLLAATVTATATLAACAAVLTAGTANAAPAPAASNVSNTAAAPTPAGSVLQTIVGAGIVAPGEPAYEYLDVTNKTGATLGTGWSDRLSFGPLDPNGIQTFFNQVTLQANVWNGQAYVPVPAGAPLPALSKALAPGATAVYRIRVDLVKYAATTAAGQLRLNVDDVAGDTADAGSTVLTILRDPQTGPNASASASAAPTGSAAATPSPSTSAAASAAPSSSASSAATPAATPAATIPPSAQATASVTGATLAETGSSDTGLLAGIALALLGAGTAVTFVLRRRTSRR